MLGDAKITCFKQRMPSLLKLTHSQSEVFEIDFKNIVKLFFVFLRLKVCFLRIILAVQQLFLIKALKIPLLPKVFR
ncbi:hypothetical protein M0802_016985 [Mischocyttarus mexicanus]|nr:hypothetical protein M0802_016985 [Mischocyttarus mexicanus]